MELIHRPEKEKNPHIPAVHSGVIKKINKFPYLTGVPAAIQVHQRSLRKYSEDVDVGVRRSRVDWTA